MPFELIERPIEISTRDFAPGSAGAVVTFEGLVRNVNEGRPVVALEYSAYPELALKEGEKILEEARQRFPLEAVKAVHRVGRLEIGDLAVWIAVASGHRGEAFEACRWIIDEIKERVPLWKKEIYADGDSGWLRANPPKSPV